MYTYTSSDGTWNPSKSVAFADLLASRPQMSDNTYDVVSANGSVEAKKMAHKKLKEILQVLISGFPLVQSYIFST